MKSFINDDFMLKNETAKKLYTHVAGLPVIDYHCHLSPKLIAGNYRFRNACDLFLGGDHYKWRQMRTNGVDERYITGDAPDYEKFRAFAATMPYLLGNPIYHWTHLELKRYFGIDKTLSDDTCDEIWHICNEKLAQDDFTAQALIRRSNVELLCTTDDPADSLEYHAALRGFGTKILPAFRPDRVLGIDKDTFVPYMKAAGISSYAALETWLRDRIAFFDANGCRLSDHSLEYVPYATGNPRAAFDAKMAGQTLSREQTDSFRTAILTLCAGEYSRRGWAMQLHIGALRNNNSRMFAALGADAGFDSVNDLCIAEKLSSFLDSLDAAGILPKTILYTLNPKDNYVLGAMLGNFQCAPLPGKLQFGSAWWFNDQRDGMVEQLRALANLGMLPRFVGMLTDSRSFVSYPRHEYFRRILCSLIGEWVENGEYPEDYATLNRITEGICYRNAKEYFGF